METLEQFVDNRMEKLETFNSSRPNEKRVRGKRHKERVRKGLKRGYELREMGGQDVEAIRAEIRKEMFGSGIMMMLMSFIISNWGDDIINWIINELFPAQSTFQTETEPC